jgi:hypothetical protein
MRDRAKKEWILKSEVELIIQNYIRNIQMNDYGKDSGIPQLYAVKGQISKLPAKGAIVLPCKVGDTVYEIQPIRQRIQAYDVTTVKYNGHYYWFTWILKDRRGLYGNVEGFTDMQIGKTVFLTKEEAEKALKERERN